MTVSILSIAALLPSGIPQSPLSYDELGRWLAVNCGRDVDKDRNNRHALRDELYRDGGESHMASVIDQVFGDANVRLLRKKWIRYARFNNAIKRIVNELSTVYSEPAIRRVTDDASNERYQLILDAVRMDERMVEVNRMLNLHRALLVGFRVRKRPDDTREPVLDVATPANVRAVMHPNDDTEVIGWMIRTSYRTARRQMNDPKWTLWTDHESVQLRDDLSVIGDTYQVHNLGVCPWVSVTLGPPASGFWPGNEGEDLTAAHVAIWFQNILTLKESKSATKMPIITGDGTTMARGQGADSESPMELADGQSITTVDMSMDLEMFRDNTDHILRHTAANYGISPALIEHQGVQSAEARELMRMPLRELRRQQQVPFRRFESRLAAVMSAIVAVDMPDSTFDVTGWRMEFEASETPLDPLSEMTLFERRRTAGLDNTAAMLMRQRPGLTEADALEMIENNVLVETERNRLMRPLMAINGEMGGNSRFHKAASDDEKSDDEDKLTDKPTDGAAAVH